MLFIKHHLVMVIITLVVLAIYAIWWNRPVFRSGYRKTLLVVLILLTSVSMVLESRRMVLMVPGNLAEWIHSLGLVASLLSILWFCAEQVDWTLVRLFGRKSPSPGSAVVSEHPSRRQVLQLARRAVYAAPVATFGYGTFVERFRFRTQEIDLPVAGLPAALDGLRIVQITDLHMGAYLDKADMERIIGMANETKAHLAIMTGDLITAPGDPVDECIAQLARVKADAGMIGCMGNHEQYADVEDYVKQRAALYGIQFLRSERRSFEFRGHKLNFGGVDYQTKGQPYLVGAESLIEPGVPNILLSHNPDVFPVAAAKGFAATLSGHTHGGQITVEYLSQYVNPARFYTRYVSGLYQEGPSSIYVSRGLGTVGLPVRLGASPELTVLRLRAG